jgi:hypothetical protein
MCLPIFFHRSRSLPLVVAGTVAMILLVIVHETFAQCSRNFLFPKHL